MVVALTIFPNHLADVLLRNYDARFAIGDATFPLEVDIPGLLEPRVAIEETLALSVRVNLRLALGMVSTIMADIHQCCLSH